MDRGRDHRFDHVAGLGCTGRDGGRFDRRNRHADADRVNILVLGIGLIGIDVHEPFGITQAGRTGHRIHPGERRDEHGIAERNFLSALQQHLAGLHLFDRTVRDRRDGMFGELVLHETARSPHSGQSHMPDIGFRRDEIDRHFLPQLLFPEVGVQDERHLIGRSETGGALSRPDDDGTGIFEERLVRAPGLLGMVHIADGLGIATGAQPRDRAKIQLGPRRDDQIVVGYLAL